jgi:hypothetical protein
MIFRRSPPRWARPPDNDSAKADNSIDQEQTQSLSGITMREMRRPMPEND